jgi:hypothetical protein
MYRLQYRSFASCPFGSGSCGALTVNHAVDVDGSDHAGIRWYILKIDHGTGAVSLDQQGTYSPDSDHRWMGSAALDGLGNLGVGFSVSSSLTSPSIRYAGRLAGDPAGTLGQGEATLTGGAGSQTGSNRWGDYTMLTVDPEDDCTFWYTNQYYSMSSATGWHTRIGSFQLASSCPTPPSRGTLEGVVTDLLTGLPIEGALVLTSNGFASTTDAAGQYSLALPPGTYTVTASALDHGPAVVSGIAVAAGATTMQDFALPRPAPDLTGSLADVTQSCRARRGVARCRLGGTLVLTNQGPVNAPGFLVRIYLSEDSALDGGDTLLKEISFRSLRAGRTQRKSVKVRLPDGTSASDKFLIAAIDPDNTVFEEDKTNNMPMFGPIPPPPP